MQIEHITKDKPNPHWSIQNSLNAYIYTDVYSDQLYNKIEQTVLSQLDNPNTDTYKTHGATFTHNNKKFSLVSNKESDREQLVVYDLTFEKDYWHQTIDTIHDWSWQHLQNNIHPLFYRHLTTFKNLEPFADEPDSWIPYRWHFNYNKYSKYLALHTDMADTYFNTPNSWAARGKSVTFYLHDYIEDGGGEFYTLGGDFVYRPKKNQALCINGNGITHGVNSTMTDDGKPRLAFTVRWAHKDDLYLPGHPDKTLYKLGLNV
tara:strand:+ start:66 stop:848 length:783 start_codon:yes stop_codon:yes gene_type:complete